MKTSDNKHINRSVSSLLAVLIALLLPLISCQEWQDIPVPNPQPDNREVALYFALKAPAHVMPRTKALDPEQQINRAKILVFEKESEDYHFKYILDARQMQTDNENNTRFCIQLKTTPKDLLFLAYANYGDAFAEYEPPVGESPANVKKAVVATYNSNLDGNLPMYAEAEHLGGLLADTVVVHAVMLRAVARVDVAKELTDDSMPFTLTDTYIYRTQTMIQLAPDTEHLAEGTLRVQEATVPGISQLNSGSPLLKSATDSGAEIIEQLYVPESGPVESNLSTDATTIVVGGYYDSDSRKSYYRVDFKSGPGNHSFGQILRNHKYRFNIKKVLVRGYPTPEEAANSTSSSMLVEVQTWEDFTTEMYFSGDNYLGISSRDVVLRYRSDYQKEIFVQSSLPYTITWKNPSTGKFTEDSITVYPTQEIAVHYDKSFYALGIKKKLETQSDVTMITLTTLISNRGDTPLIDEFQIESGSWNFIVNVTQETFAKYASKTIRVLSGTGIGSLGHLFSTLTEAVPLRKILDNPSNFSPSGSVTINGFSFSATENTNMRYSAGSTTQAYFRKALYSSDVLVLTYDNHLSVAAAYDIYDWITGAPNRVLIVGGDSYSTSGNLLRTGGDYLGLLTGEIDWWYYSGATYQVENLGGEYMIPEPTLYTAEFFNGPFGKVTPYEVVNRSDAIAGFAKAWGSEIYPILTPVNYPDYFSIGVNKQAGIIFVGDSQLFHSGQMSTAANGSGTISSNFDRLISNLWGWIAEKVVWEE